MGEHRHEWKKENMKPLIINFLDYVRKQYCTPSIIWNPPKSIFWKTVQIAEIVQIIENEASYEEYYVLAKDM